MSTALARPCFHSVFCGGGRAPVKMEEPRFVPVGALSMQKLELSDALGSTGATAVLPLPWYPRPPSGQAAPALLISYP